MKHLILKNAGFGAKFGLVSLIAYTIIANLFEILWGVFSGYTLQLPISYIIMGLLSNFMYFGIFLILPFVIICTLTSIIFTLILIVGSSFNENLFTGLCTTLCISIAIAIYLLTTNMIYNIDEETTIILNLMFRTIPYFLFIIWGYFLSRRIYQTIKCVSNGQPSSS